MRTVTTEKRTLSLGESPDYVKEGTRVGKGTGTPLGRLSQWAPEK